MPKQLIVQFTPIKTCLVNLPSQWVNALLDQRKVPQNVILEISWANKPNNTTKKTYFGWSGEASKPLPPNSVFTHGANGKLDVLEIDPQLGTAIGITEGQKVNVEFCRNIPECTSVNVEPHTEDDWEILELHAGYVEENLLSQIRVVYTNQLMCVWIHGKTLVRLRVAEMNPNHGFVKLSSNTEVIVAPKVRQAIKPAESSTKLSNQSKDQQMVVPHVCLRNLPELEQLSITTANTTGVVNDMTSVFIHPDDVQNIGQDIVRITKIIPGYASSTSVTATNTANTNNNPMGNGRKSTPSNIDNININNNDDGKDNVLADDDTALPAKSVYASVQVSSSIPQHHILLGSVIKSTLNIQDFDIVKLTSATLKKATPTALVFKGYSTPAVSNSSIKLGLDSSSQNQAQEKAQREKSLIQGLRKLLTDSSKDTIVLTNGLVLAIGEEKGLIQFGQKKRLFGTFSNGSNQSDTTGEQYAVLTKSQIKDLQIDIGEDIIKSDDTTKTKKTTTRCPEMGGVEKIFDKLHKYTIANLAKKDLKNALSVPGSGGVLVTGSHGAGKTELVKKLLYTVRNDPSSLIYTLEINCAEIADERIPNLKEMIQKWYDEAAWYAPSMVFFDDIDRLIPAEVEHADSTRSRHIAELFTQMTVTMTKRHSIMVIATSQQQQSIHPSLITNHVFTNLRHLNPPSREERKLIMQSIMSQGPEVLAKSLPNIDLVSVSSETEGYLAADLKALIERAVHEGAVRSIKDNNKSTEIGDKEIIDTTDPTIQQALELIQQDFSQAREGFVPSSLRGVKLQSSGVNWSDIGGLNETRRALLETLEWPTKYATVFAQCPLRLRSGLLLYGYPGCGKTLLASAVAKECGLNFISVKGPEILNKYIGASEKSVRDLFERAQAAKPCVLFFDEFDSIAPRRGHDSTGVTDRVVNQMLTQMDGAEGLDGVYVLAATSRPDLIDPALLRPGRLDKALLCGMPNFDERLEILQALAQKMTLASEVNLNDYAEKTEGFSGADLQGFLYNAHLEAIHGAIDIDSFKEQQKKEKEQSDSSNEPSSDFVMTGGKSSNNTKAPLTLAEKGQISQRLAMIKKGVKGTSKTTQIKKNTVVEHVAAITIKHLEKSLKSTRPSITAEEQLRLQLIYDEFVTGRTGELPSGEGAKGIGKRSTLG
ncbi:P-loop containing nucleoside triphosphate hydrolase protein [Cunninghamella echinulata]|nr:P-loop containing nucleoside triphosphate hydrolase protein [Cunninghamella echinulata]